MFDKILNNLKTETQALLLNAFNLGLDCHIKYATNRVIGINTPPPNVTVTETNGIWYLGTIK